MIRYFRVKFMELKIKEMLYGTILGVMNEQKDIISLVQRLYVTLKDVPVEDLQKEFIGKLAEIIHNENPKKDS